MTSTGEPTADEAAFDVPFEPPFDVPLEVPWELQPWDESRADVRVDGQLARAEVATSLAARAAAQQQAAIVEVLAEARRHPEVYIPLDGEPTRRELDIAQSAAIADLAVRLSISEATVASLARHGEVLRDRAPRLWAAFGEGEVSAANARATATVLESLPDDPGVDGLVDARAVELARLVPPRFRERLRAYRERVHPESMAARHERARCERRLWREHDRDGMAFLELHLGSAEAELAWQHVDAAARHLAARDDEARTLDQLRADVAADLLTGRSTPETAPRVTVGVLVPMLTLLGQSDEPGRLDGRVPIDADTARRLAGGATSFHRLLTHPVTSTILDVDRTTYRPPADLVRWLRLRDVTCRFPGCGIPAARCDLDHTVAWAQGGPTSDRNLGHLSGKHHTVKHESLWSAENHGDGTVTWTSPTGFTVGSDPPPF